MTFVDLPVVTQIAIGGIVTALLSLLIQFVGSYVPWLEAFLAKYKEEWGVAISAALVAWIQNALPGAEYAGVSVMAVQLVVAIVVLVLAKYGLAKARVRGFR